MAPTMSSARELAIASRKRSVSPALSESDRLSDLSESPSDFETPSKPSRKPVRKKARTARASTPSIKGEVISKIPKEYQSEEGNPLFSVKWYKEITKRERFWTDFKKKVPKGVWSKRFKVEIMVDLNEEGGKGVRGGEKTTVAIGKTTKITSARKTTRKPADNTSVDLVADLDVTKDAPIASTEVVEDERDQVQPKDTIMPSDDIKLDDGAAEPSQEPTSTEPTNPKENDDLISKALADPNTTPDKRAMYIAVREQQERAAKVIETEVEEQNRLEKARQKRAEAQERKAAKEANAEAGEAEEQALDVDEGGKIEKPRKMFNPTRF